MTRNTPETAVTPEPERTEIQTQLVEPSQVLGRHKMTVCSPR